MSDPLASRERWLARPSVFSLFNHLIGTRRTRRFLAERHIRASKGDRILDIGCGTADVLAYLPGTEYVGFDHHEPYIRTAQERYGARGTFTCGDLREKTTGSAAFDRVLALGILHHLPDDDVVALLRAVQSTLKPGGHLVTFDGCYVEAQSRLARWILSKDRGEFVRTPEAYSALASRVFPHVKVFLYNDLLRIPYSHIIMECSL